MRSTWADVDRCATSAVASKPDDQIGIGVLAITNTESLTELNPDQSTGREGANRGERWLELPTR